MKVPYRSRPVRDALVVSRTATVAVLVTSLVANVLMLTGPLFMLQVYDRVLVSRSVPTLVTLTVAVAVVYAFYGVIDAMRAMMVHRIGALMDEQTGARLYEVAVRMRLVPGAPQAADPIRDGEQLRAFVGGQAVLAFLDLPWVPVYVAVVFLIHVDLGWLVTAGAVAAVVVLVASELAVRTQTRAVSTLMTRRQQVATSSRDAAEAIVAMGMLPRLRARWEGISGDLNRVQATMGDRASSLTSLHKGLRFFLQSAVLAVGAHLVIKNEMSPGMMIAASVMSSRALAPVEQVVGSWKVFVSARQAHARVRAALDALPVVQHETLMPQPVRGLRLANVAVGPPGCSVPFIGGVGLDLAAGDGLAVVGPSGAGKSSLVKALASIWPALGGDHLLDGVPVAHYTSEQLGQVVGYLPQRVELVDGTVAQNISRFAPLPPSEDVLAAARLAGVHEMIAMLPDGYDTPLGAGGVVLSAGQQQRIALARAVYGNPFLVVLDEPNSNLDTDGDVALASAISQLRLNGSIVVVVSHRTNILEVVSHVLVLHAGRQVTFGPAADVVHGNRLSLVRQGAEGAS
ncbi:type I secretion system permease/ATPase [Cellulomonas xiejunii]|uniref:type I secretion system permease/ATPase n=1 Tax=Cellulomonas xiejunii TaxID=2968083 RepID=UPI001D0E0292|nr:type I secretion system permease/ATPase [Cellulomonas xiejunii]MCC2314055.1 type I secretion system permease/ATPase [Cellulomonas xiejunii]